MALWLSCAVVLCACSEKQPDAATQAQSAIESARSESNANARNPIPGVDIVNGPDVPLSAAEVIFASSTASSPRALVNTIGVDQEQAESINQELSDFFEAYGALGSRLMTETCSRREMLVTRDDLAREHARRDRLLAEGGQEMFSAILDDLPPAIAERLLLQVERIKRNTTGTRLDPYVYYREAQVNVEGYLDHACEITSRDDVAP